VAEDQGKEEEKFDFTAEGEGYMSLDEARVLAMRTAAETPGDYGRNFRGTLMVFDVVESTETDDHYMVTLSVRPQGNFDGTPGQEQFVIGKDGTIALRQVLSLPTQTSASPAGTARTGGGFPVLPVAIGVVIVGAIAAVGAVLALGSSGSDSVPIAAVPPTETPTSAPAVIPADTSEPTADIEATVEAGIQQALASSPTSVPVPTATYTPIPPTKTPTPTPKVPPTPVPTIDIANSPLPEVVNDNPPHIFVGTVTIDGELAPDGTEVSAWMMEYSEPLASSIVPSVAGQPGSYSLLVPQYGRHFNGTVLMIKVNGNFVTNAAWLSGEGEVLNLVP
jgi:hypothetical protein